MSAIVPQTYMQIFLRFLRFGFLAWGGPVAQIAMIKKELVLEEKWISIEQFNRALAVYQVLPGPEAHELCVYFGMKAKGRWGGFLAGLGFMLPGFLLMLALTWFYVQYGIRSAMVQLLFTGIQAAIVALIFFAVYRIGKHAIINGKLFIIALASAVGFYFNINFLVILLCAGLVYMFWNKKSWLAMSIALAFIAFSGFTIYRQVTQTDKIQASSSQVNRQQSSPADIFIVGLKGGLLSFGGAYTAIPIVREDAVIQRQWMSSEQFLDGIAVSGILPAPLIIFSTFVGYFGAGWWGALLITLGVFLPAFSFTLIGHSLMEKLISNTALHNFLDGITAGVIGLIAVTAIQLLLATVNSWMAVIIFSIALLLLIRFRSKYMALFIIVGAGVFSLLWHYAL